VSVQAVVTSLPPPGGTYLAVTLLGEDDPVPAFLPPSLPLSPHVGQRVLLDVVGRVPVVRCEAP